MPFTALASLESKNRPQDLSLILVRGRKMTLANNKTKDSGMRSVEFTDSSPPRMAAGEGNNWILDLQCSSARLRAQAGCSDFWEFRRRKSDN
jgi:hypothetical protein